MSVSTGNISLHIWAPDIKGEKGGIQRYSYFFIKAIAEEFPSIKIEVFLKNAKCVSFDKMPQGNIKYYFFGNYPFFIRTLIFGASIFLKGFFQHPTLIISLHSHFSVVSWWLKRTVNIKYWLVAHGTEIWVMEKEKLKRICSNADRVISVSNFTKNHITKAIGKCANSTLLPTILDTSKFCIQKKPQYLLKKFKLKDSQPIIFTVARLAKSDSYKGYDNIILALPLVRVYFPDICYMLIGDGDDVCRIKELINRCNVSENVKLAGFVPDSQLADYYNLCDIFAMPSKGEGFGIVFIEALACGKPVLAGNKDGSVDALANGELGALVNPDDLNEIANALIQILQGIYPNPIMYKPEILRQKTIEYFGFDKFKMTLKKYLEDFLYVQEN